jgi:hypothetical protein
VTAAVLVIELTLGDRVIDEVTAEPVDEKEWLKLIHRMVERTFTP